MQKKVIAAAIAGAFAAPVVASAADGAGSSTVQVFGTVYVEYSVYVDQGRNAGAGVQPDRTKADFLQTPGSEIGFKGEERLGGGLSAWYQCTSTADPRGQSQNGFCSRNSALGLKGAFGNVFIGNWDTPFKRTISPNAVGGNDTGIWGTAFLLTGDSTTTGVGANRAAFKRRQNNSINYDSPNFGGFQVMGSFTASQPSTGTLDNQTNNKPRVWSLGLQYSAGPLYVSGGYEEHRQYAGGGGPDGSKDRGWHIGAAYTWGPVRVGGLYTRQKFDVPGGDVTAKAWHVGVDWKIAGPHGLRAAYTQAGDMSGVAGVLIGTGSGSGYRPAPTPGVETGATLYQIRYVYTFSKRTEFNVGYVRLNNDDGAAYNLGGLNGAHAAGENQSAVAFSMRHTF
ncbi:MAG: porin [Burkholderiales bacterium]